MRRLATLATSLLFAGCAMESATTHFVAPTIGSKAGTEPANVRRDEAACADYAEARPSEKRYASYVACLVGRGHQTYASILGGGGATGITLQADRGQTVEQTYGDLTQCAAGLGARVDMPPHQDLFRGKEGELATGKWQRPFAACLERAGYSTTLHTTPSSAAVASAVMSGAASTPQSPAATPPTPVINAPPVSPPATVPPAQRAPAAATARPPMVAAVPAPSEARAPRPVKLGLYVDPATSPPVVTAVASNTPAGQAGVRPGDVVVMIDATPIRSEEDIATALAAKRPGDVVRLEMRRGSQRIQLDATLAEP